MKQFTNKEIIEACVGIWDEQEQLHNYRGAAELDIDVLVNTPTLVKVEFSAMYDSPILNLIVLMNLAEFFGTKNINDDDKFSNYGCETCDYGSSYGFTLTIRPE